MADHSLAQQVGPPFNERFFTQTALSFRRELSRIKGRNDHNIGFRLDWPFQVLHWRGVRKKGPSTFDYLICL